MQLEKFYIIEGIIYWNGGRIGGSKETVEIAAATENPIIRHPITGIPYIPGSSLKGKIRSLLELSTEKARSDSIKKKIEKMENEEPQNKNSKEHERWEKELEKWRKRLELIKNGEPCGCGLESCQICRAFGPHKNTDHLLGPTRLIFRDAKMATQKDVKNIENLPEEKYTLEDIKRYSTEKGLHYAEVKSENIINRHTGRASDPRQMERVIDGSLFKFEVILRVFEGDEEQKKNKKPDDNPSVKLLKQGVKLLEQDYLGGSGSRGYGKVKFYDMKINGNPWSNFDK
jgi:CRISPR-associated protein Csm3